MALTINIYADEDKRGVVEEFICLQVRDPSPTTPDKPATGKKKVDKD